MRLRRKPWTDEAIKEFSSFVFTKDSPASTSERGMWRQIFGGAEKLFVELGTGKGDFITTMAARDTLSAYIGIEAEQSVLYTAAKKVAAMRLFNVRLLTFDASRLIDIFAPGEIDAIFLNFCDPWPKKRHEKRRLTNRRFLEIYRSLLRPGGRLFFKTDNAALFDYSLDEFLASGMTVEGVTRDLHAAPPPDNVETEYEKRFRALGVKICRCEAAFP